MKISFVIPAYNSSATLRICLEAIAKLDTHNFTVDYVVVDNNSTDETSEIARELGMRVITCPIQGRSQARNFGATHTDSEFIAFIDSDIVLERKWLTDLMKLFTGPYIGAVQGSIKPYRNGHWVNEYRFERKLLETNGKFLEMESPFMNRPLLDSAAFIVRRRAFEHLEGFDETLIRGEDLDFSTRIVESGYSLRAVTNPCCHKIENRSLLGMLLRSFHMDFHYFTYQAQQFPETQVRFLIDMIQIRKWPKFSSWKYHCFHFLMEFFGKLGAVLAYLAKPKPRPLTKQWPEAKLNLLLPALNIEGKAYHASLIKRFTLTSDTLIFYGFPHKSTYKFKEASQLDFFKSYLEGNTFSHNSEAIKEFIARGIFVQGSYV